ncbi:hypothetical protein CR513_58653, partial [Mucuna pruriens]
MEEHVRRRHHRVGDLPGHEERVRNLRDLDGETANFFGDLENGIQKPQPIGEFHGLSFEDVVGGFHL